MADEHGQDRRQHARHPVSFPVDYIGGVIGCGQAADLSPLGCAIASDTPVPVQTYLKIQLSLPGGATPLEIELAVVRWSYGSLFGVEFIAFGELQKARLRRFLASAAGLSIESQQEEP